MLSSPFLRISTTPNARQLTGLRELHVINEPRVAALAYGLNHSNTLVSCMDLKGDHMAIQHVHEATQKAKSELSSTTQTESDLPLHYCLTTSYGIINFGSDTSRSH